MSVDIDQFVAVAVAVADADLGGIGGSITAEEEGAIAFFKGMVTTARALASDNPDAALAVAISAALVSLAEFAMRMIALATSVAVKAKQAGIAIAGLGDGVDIYRLD